MLAITSSYTRAIEWVTYTHSTNISVHNLAWFYFQTMMLPIEPFPSTTKPPQTLPLLLAQLSLN